MYIEDFALLVAALLIAYWLLRPYLVWQSNVEQPVESFIARSSFPYPPGGLVRRHDAAPQVSLSVIIPAYNEELRLGPMLEETLLYLEGRRLAKTHENFTYEVIVVDDGSRDGTYEAAVRSQHGGVAPRMLQLLGQVSPWSGEVKVLRLTQNCGKGFAVRLGMLVARGRLLLMADADGSTEIREVERLEFALEQKRGQADLNIAFGSRHHLCSFEKEQLRCGPWARRVVSGSFDFFVRLFTGGCFLDTQCGFKLFHASVGKKIFESLHLARWAFDLEVLQLARLMGQSVVEVPVAWVEISGSKLRPWRDAACMLRDTMVMQTLYILGVWAK